MERTLILVKPDAVARGLVGEVLRRVEAKGYSLVAVELRHRSHRILLCEREASQAQAGDARRPRGQPAGRRSFC